MEGRWTHYEMSGKRDSRGDAEFTLAIPVVPCDDAAIERAVAALVPELERKGIAFAAHSVWPRHLVERALRAAGETP